MKKIYLILGSIFMTAFALMAVAAYANTSYFAPTAASATASSTVQFLTAASATLSTSTPMVYDSYGINGTNQNPGQKYDATDSVTLMEYVTASTTATIYRTNVEYSDGIAPTGNPINCVSTPNACDWYDNNLDTYAAGAIAIAVPNSYTWTYASTTHDTTLNGAPSLENRGSKLIGLKTPLRYVRVFVSVSGGNGAIYMKFVPKKQNP